MELGAVGHEVEVNGNDSSCYEGGEAWRRLTHDGV